MPMELSGKPIAITGASSGIGLATALACARAGMPVALAARRLDKLEEAVARIKSHGGNAIAVACNVDDPADGARLIDATVRAFGGIYSVFANAGYGFEESIQNTSDDQLRAIFETNVWGTMNTVRPALTHMSRAGAGHIIMCSSCLSKLGMPYYAAYSATKAVQDHFARAMRLELGPAGIHVSSVHPIGTRTEFFERASARSRETRLSIGTPDHMLQSPDVVAGAIVRCLRRPRGEVWTSPRMRYLLGLTVLAPQMTDWVLRRALRKLRSRDPIK